MSIAGPNSITQINDSLTRQEYYNNEQYPGVKYIKIARFDSYGNDNYQSLRELDNIRIRTEDNKIIDYPIVSITEYPSSSLNNPYFLYRTISTNITSSTNNQILNYRASASRNHVLPLSPITEAYVTNFTESVDVQNYFNSTTGIYTLGNTPNILLLVTCSILWDGSPNNTRVYAAIATLDSSGQVDSLLGGGYSPYSTSPATFIFSSSFTPIENQRYVLYVANFDAFSFNINTASLSITQSQSPVAGIGAQTVLEPYITTPFINSDYDVLMNNAVENQYSNTYLKVDYVNNPNVPQNLISILSGSTAPATVQDSNYTLAGYINSRYIGKGLTSRQLNKWTAGDISGNEKIPNVSILKTYFGEFNWLAGTAPEWGGINDGKIQTSLRYIVDENGTKLSPIDDEEKINLDIIDRTFTNSNAIIQLTNPNAFGTNMDSLNGTFSVFKAGKRIKPIIYTQVANYDSSGNIISYTYTGSLTFVQGGASNNTSGIGVNDYRMVTFANETQLNENTISSNSNSTGSLKWNPPIQLGQSASFATSSAGINPSTGSIYKPTGSLGSLSGSGYILNIEASIDTFSNIRKNANTFRTGFVIVFNLQKSTNGTTWESLDSHNCWIPGIDNSFDYLANSPLNYTDNNATTSSQYRITYDTEWNVSSPFDGHVNILNTSYFKITQFPSPGTGNVTQFWATSSAAGSKNLLFAKTGSSVSNAGLNSVWGQKQQDINQSGFDPIVLDFIPQAYDEIRFEGTETQTYTITQVSQSIFNGSNVLTLVLDRNITSNINTDYFLLRRYVDEVGNIIINTTKPAGGTSDGIIVPEFVTKNVKEVSRNVLGSLVSSQQN